MSHFITQNYEINQQQIIITVLWEIPKIRSVLDNIKNKFNDELRTDNIENLKTAKYIMGNSDDLQPPEDDLILKIKFLGKNNDMLEIYYLFPKSIFMKSTFEIYRRGNSQSILVTGEYHKIQSNKWQYLTTLFKKDITNFENQFILKNESLKLGFKFEIITYMGAPDNDPKGELSNDFQNLLDSRHFSDVIIKSAEGEEFNVHKAIVASRSNVLKAHFDHNTLECHTNIVESPLETDILSEVLTFIYTGKSPRVDDIPEKLLAAADFYQLDKLKSLCEQALQEKLSVDNVLETLELAELHSATKLKNLSLEFIKDGHTQHITRTEGWTKVKSIELIKSIYEYVTDFDDKAE